MSSSRFNAENMGLVLDCFYTKSDVLMLQLTIDNYDKFRSYFKTPFDALLSRVMRSMLEAVCPKVQGLLLGYYSEEGVVLLIKDPSCNLSELVSAVSSLVTLEFYRSLDINISRLNAELNVTRNISKDFDLSYHSSLIDALYMEAIFKCSVQSMSVLDAWDALSAIFRHVELVGLLAMNRITEKNEEYTVAKLSEMLLNNGVPYTQYTPDMRYGGIVAKREDLSTFEALNKQRATLSIEGKSGNEWVLCHSPTEDYKHLYKEFILGLAK